MAIYEKYRGKATRPCSHPVVGAMADEWRSASHSKREPSLKGIPVSALEKTCRAKRKEEPKWHPDLTSLDIEMYLAGMPTKKMWWLPEHVKAAVGVDSMAVDDDDCTSHFTSHRILMLTLCLVDTSNLPPLPSSREPSDPPNPPSPMRMTRSKGKAREHVPDKPSAPVPQSTQKGRGVKRRAAADYPTGPHEIDRDDDRTPKRTAGVPSRALPRVEVEVPSPPRIAHPTQDDDDDDDDDVEVARGKVRLYHCICCCMLTT